MRNVWMPGCCVHAPANLGPLWTLFDKTSAFLTDGGLVTLKGVIKVRSLWTEVVYGFTLFHLRPFALPQMPYFVFTLCVWDYLLTTVVFLSIASLKKACFWNNQLTFRELCSELCICGLIYETAISSFYHRKKKYLGRYWCLFLVIIWIY